MHEDNQTGLKLRCPECQALLRIRDLKHIPETFSCVDCGQLLEVQLHETGKDGSNSTNHPEAGVQTEQEITLRRAQPPAGHLPPAVVGQSASSSRKTRQRSTSRESTTGSDSADSPLRRVVFSLKTRLRAAWLRSGVPTPSAKMLSWLVAGTLLCGLLLLYLPDNEAGSPDSETNGPDVAGELAVNDQPPVAQQMKSASPDDPVGTLQPGGAAGPDVLSDVPPDFLADAADRPGPDAAPENPPAAEQRPDRAEQPPERIVEPVAQREPVVAPQPQLPAIPPVNVEDRLAVRLRSYRTLSPVAVRQLLLDLEEMTGVPFQLEEGNRTFDGWRERTVMIDADDVTVGELLNVVAERAGLTVRTGGAVIRVSPLPNPDAAAGAGSTQPMNSTSP